MVYLRTLSVAKTIWHRMLRLVNSELGRMSKEAVLAYCKVKNARKYDSLLAEIRTEHLPKISHKRKQLSQIFSVEMSVIMY
jgi:hypothetical protein